jgi:hypothetical protein
MSPTSTKYVNLRWPFFYMKHSWTNFLNLGVSLEWGMVV